jgi:hypothetical protein
VAGEHQTAKRIHKIKVTQVVLVPASVQLQTRFAKLPSRSSKHRLQSLLQPGILQCLDTENNGDY